MFNSVKKYYGKGLYDDDDVKVFVVAGYITEAEYKEITGVDYNTVPEEVTEEPVEETTTA